MKQTEHQTSRRVTANPPARASHLRRWAKPCLWLVVIGSFLLALHGPISTVTRNRLGLQSPTGPRDSREFTAILYQRPTGTSDAPAPLDRERIHAQIQVLMANGYQPVSLTDIKRLLANGTPLPRRALLIGVDGQDGELLQALDNATRRPRWGGAIMIATAPLEQGSATVTWHNLQALQHSGRWEIATSGHEGNIMVPVTSEGFSRAHLTSRQWLPHIQERETMEAFTERILNDHEKAAALIAQRLGTSPQAYLYPGGDAGQLAPADDASAGINTMAVQSFYDLAFVTSDLARNTIYTAPERLHLLPVNPHWTGKQLLDTLQQASLQIETVEEAPASTIAGGWTLDRGTARPTAQGFILQPAGQTTDARIWLGGSDQLRDFHAAFQLQLNEAALHFHLMAKPDAPAGLEVVFAPEGSVTVALQQDAEPAATRPPPRIIARAQATLLPETPHTIEFFLRRNSLDIHLDGASIFERTVALPSTLAHGQIGIAMQSAETATRQPFLQLQQATLQRPPAVLASWNLTESQVPYIVDHVHRNGTMLTDLSPPLQLPGALEPASGNQELFRKLANVYHLRLSPKLSIANDQDMRTWNPELLLRSLSEQQGDGLYISFAQHSELTVPALDGWIQQVSRVLSGSGKSLLIRMPVMLERLAAVNAILAVVPTVEIVTGSPGLGATAAGLNNRTIQERQIPEPSPETLQNLPATFTLPEENPQTEEGLQERIRRIAAEAEQAFSRGAFESAIAHFSVWHDLAPTAPEPLQRIGDALINLGYHDEAVGFYRQSLDLRPENIRLAIQLARLLTDTGARASARSLLNIYARLFPENTPILLAQADWLLRDNRRAEALERVEHVRKIDPDNFEAALFNLRIADNDEQTIQAIQELIERSQGPQGRRRLMQAVMEHDLLTLQHAYLLVAFLQQDQDNLADPELRQTLQDLVPRSTTVLDDFSIVPGLSDNWHLDGLTGSLTNQLLSLQVTPTRTQAEARLRRAERWRDSFIEIDLAEANAGCWIYARKANRQLIRLGFEPSQHRLHLQIWGGPQYDVMQNHFIPWTLPATGAVLRLEVRGNGAIAYIDGKPMIDAPLELPEDFGFGWTALSLDAPARGMASITLRRITSGPLPFRAAIVPPAPTPEEDENALLERIHQLRPQLSDISPDWFRVDAAGQWHSQMDPEDEFYKIFARYYRLRLSPLVRIAQGTTISPDDILILARTHGYNGFILLFNTMPAEAWFEQMNMALNVPGLDVIAVAQAAPGSPAAVRGIAGSSTLFPQAHAPNPIEMLTYPPGQDTNPTDLLAEQAPALTTLP